MLPLRPRLALAAAALGAGALAVPAARAQAEPVLAPLKPCYVSVDLTHRESMHIRATGFTPNAAVRLSVTGLATVDLDADANGVVKTARPGPAAPYVERGEQDVTVSLAEKTPNPLNTVSATTKVTALSVSVRPRRAATSRRVRFRGRGFTRQKAIWGHYVFRHRDRRTVRFATGPTGACGTFSVRRRQMPMVRPRPGRWTLQVDQQKRWSPQPDSVFVPLPITVERIIGS